MRFRWIPWRVSAAIVALAAAACGGAEKQDVLDKNAPASSGGTTSGGTTSGGTTSGGTTSGGVGDAGGVTDAGGVDASGACVPEIESNDGKDKANQLLTSVCGNIDPNGESDFLTFVLKPTTTTMKITFEGKVTLKVDIEGGASVTLGNGQNTSVPFEKGKRYYVEVKAAVRADKVPWRVNLVEQ